MYAARPFHHGRRRTTRPNVGLGAGERVPIRHHRA
jgi:hypothetical protein